MSSYSGARGGKFEVSIGSLDNSSLTVYAQYRPSQLQIDQSVPWAKHANTGMEDHLRLEYTGAEGRSSTLELFFDASEIPNSSVEAAIADLTSLASPTWEDPLPPSSAPPPPAPPPSPGQPRPSGRVMRPHHCVLVFGRLFNKGIYKCVIESLSTKITMFSPDGIPIRATVSVRLKEASHVSTSTAPTSSRPINPPSPTSPTSLTSPTSPTTAGNAGAGPTGGPAN
jgi:hypothetical protein